MAGRGRTRPAAALLLACACAAAVGRAAGEPGLLPLVSLPGNAGIGRGAHPGVRAAAAAPGPAPLPLPRRMQDAPGAAGAAGAAAAAAPPAAGAALLPAAGGAAPAAGPGSATPGVPVLGQAGMKPGSAATAVPPIGLHGSGTTNTAVLLWRVFEELYVRARPAIRITYRAIGSTTGQKARRGGARRGRGVCVKSRPAAAERRVRRARGARLLLLQRAAGPHQRPRPPAHPPNTHTPRSSSRASMTTPAPTSPCPARAGRRSRRSPTRRAAWAT
jgi:hypothetical protein